MKSISLILLGSGGVGHQLLHHIISCRPVHAKEGVRLRVVGVSDSKSLLISPDVFTKELDDEILKEICRVKQSGSPLSALGSGACPVFSDTQITSKLMDIAGHLGRSTGLALLDCSASVETFAMLKKVTDIGCCIVLANKKPLSSSLDDYDKLMSHPRRVRRESAVGAGLPIIVTVNRLLSSGDTIHRIVGSLSGTLGYVMSEVEDGKPFSQVVKTARSLGYTEPDPRDDLSGMDVARRFGCHLLGQYYALILARLLGQRINMDDIKVESLYPDTMGPKAISVEEFLSNGLPQLDMDIEERVMRASSNGKALRYVCVIEGSRCKVGIQELPKNSALGRSRGSDNVLEVYSRCYSEQPLVIQGAGAGNDTTAAGVLADILDMQDLFV